MEHHLVVRSIKKVQGRYKIDIFYFDIWIMGSQIYGMSECSTLCAIYLALERSQTCRCSFLSVKVVESKMDI